VVENGGEVRTQIAASSLFAVLLNHPHSIASGETFANRYLPLGLLPRKNHAAVCSES
jgi:hypothetical protein